MIFWDLKVWVVVLILTFFPFLGFLLQKPDILRGLSLRKLLLGIRSLWSLQNGGSENNFIFCKILMTRKSANTLKRLGNRIEPGVGGEIQNRGAEEVILSNKNFTMAFS